MKDQQQRESLETAEFEKRLAALPNNEEILTKYREEWDKLLEWEKERRQSVEARLTTIMGLSSIAGTIVFGGILAQAAGALNVHKVWLRWAMVLGGLYLTMQLCNAIMAAVRGLSRKSYLTLTVADLLPSPGEDRFIYMRRRIAKYREEFADHRLKNDEKVTQMAVAHRAMKNFLVGLLLLAGFGVFHGIKSSDEDALIQ
ncbi:MAG: hypothetical protein ACRD2L_23550, partial [Terriglobia bacterium]